MPTPEEVKEYGLKVDELIRLAPGGPVYRVSEVNSSRAYCVPLKKIIKKVRTLDPDTGIAENREFEREGDGISISVTSLVERVDEAAAAAPPADNRQHKQPKKESHMAASAIPVASKSARQTDKARRQELARKRNDRTAGIPGSGSKGVRRLGSSNGAKAPKTVRKCFCGCGEETMSYFVPGHDARFNGWMKKIEKGDMVPDDLKKATREAVGPWKKRGDGFVPSKNYKGEPYKGSH